MLFSQIAGVLLAASAVSASILDLKFRRGTPDPNVPQGLSPTCYAAGAALYNSPIATCFNWDGYVKVLSTPKDQSIVAPYDAWLKGMCAQQACSGTDLATAFKSLATACKTDLQGWNITDAQVQAVTTAIPQYWPTIREATCLQDPAAPGTLCTTTLLTTLEKLIGGPLTEQALYSKVPGLFTTGVPKELLCNDCMKGILGILKKGGIIKDTDYANIQTYYQAQCGSPLPA